MIIEIWHKTREYAYHWGDCYSWQQIFESMPREGFEMTWSINRAIRPRAIQLILTSAEKLRFVNTESAAMKAGEKLSATY